MVTTLSFPLILLRNRKTRFCMVYSIGLCYFICAQASVYGATTDQIKSFLRKAIDYSLHANFQSRGPSSNDVENKDVSIYSGNGNIRIDTSVDQRRRNQAILISAPPEIKEQVWLTEDGNVVDHLVIERHYPTDWSWWPVIYAMTDPSRIDKGTYQLSSDRYRGIPCYKISVRYRNDDDTIVNAPPWHFQWKKLRGIFGKDSDIHSRKLTREEFDQNILALKSAYFAAIELWIDQNPQRPFIYGYRASGGDGKLLSSEDWGIVTFPEKKDESRLSPPVGAKVKSVKNNQEYSNAYIDNLTAGNIEPPSMWTTMWKWIAEKAENLWLNLLQYGGIIAFWLAMALIAIIIGLKIKQKIAH